MKLQELLDHIKKLDAEATESEWIAGYGDWKVRHKQTDCCIGEMQTQADNRFAAESRQLLPMLAKIVEAMLDEASVPEVYCRQERAAEQIIKETL